MQTQFHIDLQLWICSLAHELQSLQCACMRKCTQNTHMDTRMENPYSVTPTHSCDLRSLISAAFHLAHYQNGNLSVTHTAKSFQPITPFTVWAERKKRGGTGSSNRFSQQDQGCRGGPGVDRRKDISGTLCLVTMELELSQMSQRGTNTEKVSL